jgi:hypothetical protein
MDNRAGTLSATFVTWRRATHSGQNGITIMVIVTNRQTPNRRGTWRGVGSAAVAPRTSVHSCGTVAVACANVVAFASVFGVRIPKHTGPGILLHIERDRTTLTEGSLVICRLISHWPDDDAVRKDPVISMLAQEADVPVADILFRRLPFLQSSMKLKICKKT